MKSAGCRAVSFGIESADRAILKRVKKQITPKQVVRAVNLCRDAGITPYGSFILGLPGETLLTLKKTIAFARRLQKRGLSYGFHLLAPFPGTEIREHHRQLNIEILTEDWSQYHANRAVAATPQVSKQTLDAHVIQWEEEYLAYLGDIRKRMSVGEATTEESQQLVKLERTVVVYDLMMSGILDTLRIEPPLAATTVTRLVQIAASRLTEQIDHPAARIRDTLKNAMKQGHLRIHRFEKGCKFDWAD